jgi:hypothetical protein
MNELLIIFILSTTSLCFFVFYCVILKKFLEAKKSITKLVFDNFTLEKLIELQNNNTNKTEESIHKDNFLKFISESRDWAYEYIEEVQLGLSKFVQDVDSHINHFDTYGETLSVERPDYSAMKQISKSYKELKMLLPKESNDKF